jgi:hypothetical protein
LQHGIVSGFASSAAMATTSLSVSLLQQIGRRDVKAKKVHEECVVEASSLLSRHGHN